MREGIRSMVEVQAKKELIPNISAVEKKRLNEALAEYFGHHCVDRDPTVQGNQAMGAELSGDAFGCKNVRIDRCTPPLEVNKLELRSGKQIVLIGPNGAGKTTVFDGVMGVKAADFDDKQGHGAVVIGESVHSREGGRTRISRLNQEEMLSGLEDMRVDWVLTAAEERFKSEFPIAWEDERAYDQNIRNQEAHQRIEELRGRLKDLFELEDFVGRNVGELSGGERTKLSLCMVLLSEPDTMLLDEPTNHLDLVSLSKLSGLLDSYAKAGVAILCVSHVDSFLRQAGKHGVVEIKVDKDVRQVSQSNSPYDRLVRDRSRQEFSIVNGRIAWPERRGGSKGALITTKHEEFSIPDSPLQKVKIDPLLPGEVWVLSGDNGSGKTRLMESMVNGEKDGPFERAKSIAYLPQFWPENVAQGNVEDFFSWIRDEVAPSVGLDQAHRYANVLGNAVSIDKFIKAINDIGFKVANQGAMVSVSKTMMRDRKLSSFSGGEQRLLWFLAVSCFDTVEALVLDEPTNHMDKNIQDVVARAIQDFSGAVVFSTHDLQLLERISKDVGRKGGTQGTKNIVLAKTNGKTTISVSKQNPFAYVKARLEQAQKAAGRLRVT